jgi:MFS family permease
VVTGVSGIVGTLLGGYVTDAAVKRDGRNYCRVPVIAMLVGAPAYASVLLFDDVRPAIVALILPSICQGALLGATFAAVQTIVSPRVRATATAVLFFMINLIGLGLGPLVIGILSDWYGATTDVATGLRWAMLTVAPITLISAFCYWRADRRICNDVHVLL